MKVNSNRYPDLIDEDTGYRYRRCYMMDSVVAEVESIHENLYEGIVRTTMKVILGGN